MIRAVHIPEHLKKKLKSGKKYPRQVKEKFYWCVDMLFKNPHHPSLRHKPVRGTNNYWEFSITMNYRGVYRKENDEAFILAIAKHEDVF